MISTTPLISWRSVAAGLFLSSLVMIGLLGLGMAFGGIGMDADTAAKSAGLFSGIWFSASAFVSILAGSYFAARLSKFQTGRIGAAQGLVIASFVVSFIVYLSISIAGSIGASMGTVISKSAGLAARGAQEASENQTVMKYVNLYAEDAMSELNLRAEPSVVAQGVVTRLINGDADGAKNYLARQANITPAEADAKIASVRAMIETRIEQAKVAVGNGLESAGWAIFLLAAVGALASVLGGMLGARSNHARPLAAQEVFEGPLYARPVGRNSFENDTTIS
jgi:hypothetical protein